MAFWLKVIFLIIYFVCSYSLSKWFNIILVVNEYHLNFNFFNLVLILLCILLKSKKTNEDFYLFTFWLIFLLCSSTLFFVYIQSFVLDWKNIKDFLFNTKYISIKIKYTFDYKYDLFFKNIGYYLQNANYTLDKQNFIKNIIKDFALNEYEVFSKLSIQQIREFAKSFILMLNVIYEYQEINKNISDTPLGFFFT